MAEHAFQAKTTEVVEFSGSKYAVRAKFPRSINLDHLLDVAKFSPEHFNQNSAWFGHLPFSAWLIAELRPAILVELGVHWGHSYFSFCKAIRETGSTTKSYGVDTWQGDEHAGFYNDDVFGHAYRHNDATYADFSRLLRMSFDDAVEYFSDESVELLHIDGLHTYEAVRHDFETWLPKLADGAVVIFHDINVRERGFGVWRFWEEIKATYPAHFEFVHSHGLGVVQVKDVPESRKLPLFDIPQDDQLRLRDFFAQLGARQQEKYQATVEQIRRAELERQVHDKQREIDQALQNARQLSSDLEALRQQHLQRLQEHEQECAGLNQQRQDLERRLQDASRQSTQAREAFDASTAELQQRIDSLAVSEAAAVERTAELSGEVARVQHALGQQAETVATLQQEAVQLRESHASERQADRDVHALSLFGAHQRAEQLQQETERLRDVSLQQAAEMQAALARETNLKLDAERAMALHDTHQQALHQLRMALEANNNELGGLRGALADSIFRETELRTSTSWALTAPWRWVGAQVLRVKLLHRAGGLALRHTGSWSRGASRLTTVLRREGLQGVRLRLRFLLEQQARLNSDASRIGQAPVATLAAAPAVVSAAPYAGSVDVIVCVHNSPDDVRACLESVIAHTTVPHRLIVVDDGSDTPTRDLLRAFADGQPMTLLRNETAGGYTLAANQGLRASTSGYVVLLNSDTIVSKGWDERMLRCARSDDRIGLIGPVSNTASWQSVPAIFNDQGDWAENHLPAGWTLPRFAAEIAARSQRIYPKVGFLNGFCLMIRREVLDDLGLFDEETFAQGYGEENDYCLRATAAGWQLAVADDCYVYHAQSRSYSHERRAQLVKRAGEALDRKHGGMRIGANLGITRDHPALDHVRRQVAAIDSVEAVELETLRRHEGRRVLMLLPAGSAGGGGNIVLLEAAHMRRMGVDVRIANLAMHRELFERSHPDNTVPVIYLNSPADLVNVAPSYDAVVATLYLTVFWLLPLTRLESPPFLGYYVQDYEPDFFEEHNPERQRALDSYTAHPSIQLFTKTEWNRRMLADRLGISASWVGPSFDAERFHPEAAMRPAGGAVRVIAMVRPSTPRRAPEATMRVLRELSRRLGDGVQITIFGVRPDDAALSGYVQDFHFTNLGEIDSRCVAGALAAHDIFVDCSLFQAMGLTAMEAMACGLAVVGPIHGGLAEIIEDGSNGRLVNTLDEASIVDAVSELATNADYRARIRTNAIGVLKFTPATSASRLLDVLFTSVPQASRA